MTPKTHILKTIDTVWDAVNSGEKTFEVRLNNRFFQRGDIVCLQKIDSKGYYVSPPGQRFGTCDLHRRIGWMLQGGQFGIEPAYCVFSLELVE